MTRYLHTFYLILFSTFYLSAQDLCSTSEVSNPDCVGDSNGRIIMNPSGTPPYNYMWSHSASNSNLQSGLAAGPYTVTVTDGAGASAVCNFTLIAPTQMTIDDLVLTHPACGELDGMIEFIVTPSVTADINNLVYSIDGGSTFHPNPVFTGLGEGDYIIFVRDEHGCQVMDFTNLTSDKQGLTAMSDGGCKANDMVWIDVNASGGVPPYTYFWQDQISPYSSTMKFNDDIMVGIFIVTVTDAAGCTTSTNISLTNCCTIDNLCPANITHPTCDISDGSITVTPNSMLTPFTFAWNHDPGLMGATASNLGPGLYSVFVIDRAGCGKTCTYELLEDCPDPELCDGVTIDPTCRLGNNGEITVTPMEGTAPYSYSWAHTGVNSANVTGLTSGSYYVTVTDAQQATSECEYELGNPDQIVIIDYETTQPLCDQSGDITLLLGIITGSGSTTIIYDGSTAGFQYSIDGGSSYQGSNYFSGLGAGNYPALVQDANGCNSPIVNISLIDPQCANGIIGDYVWHDVNGNGVQDFNESGLANVQVQLFSLEDEVLRSTYTNGSGYYLFDDLEADDYYLRFINPDGYDFTLPNASANDNKDSDVDNSKGENTTAVISLARGEEELSIDAGLYKCAQLGDFVWFDFNNNEIQDPTENGINGIRVNLYKTSVFGDFFLYDSQYTRSKPDTPSDDGYYKFCVPPGRYYLEFESNPNNLIIVGANRGPDQIDSDVTGFYGFGTTHSITLTSGDMNCDTDAGYYPASSIGDRVWHDSNKNGLQDLGEESMTNVMVELMDGEGEVVAQSYTDQGGYYLFNNLNSGDYYVKVNMPFGYYPTFQNGGANDEIDSDINYEGRSDRIGLTTGQERMDIDGGVVQGSVLPVEWLSFTGENRGDYNAINWQTAAEFENDYFVVERRINKQGDFESIAEISARKQGVNVNSYDLNDYDLVSTGSYYYRIKQVDISGKSGYSNVIDVEVTSASRDVEQLELYPNPGTDVINIGFYSEIDSEASVELFDIVGESIVINTKKLNVKQGYNKVEFDISALPKGVYSVVVKNKGRSMFDNFIKL